MFYPVTSELVAYPSFYNQAIVPAAPYMFCHAVIDNTSTTCFQASRIWIRNASLILRGNSIRNSAPFNQHHSLHSANKTEMCNDCKFHSVKNNQLTIKSVEVNLRRNHWFHSEELYSLTAMPRKDLLWLVEVFQSFTQRKNTFWKWSRFWICCWPSTEHGKYVSVGTFRASPYYNISFFWRNRYCM